jgi:chromosome partitioning protein
VNLAASLADLGHRVLVLDMDPQGNAGSGFGIQANQLSQGIYEVLTDTLAPQAVVLETSVAGVDLIPSGQRLIGAEVELVSQPDRETVLKRRLASLRDRYPYILIDCPPSLGLLTVNTLVAADSVLMPIQCEYYALEGLTQLLNAIRLIQQSLNPKLDIEGILLTMYDARLNLSREVAAEARKFFSGRVYETTIPRNVRLSEAPSYGMPVLAYDRTCAGAQSYLQLAQEVMALEKELVSHE